MRQKTRWLALAYCSFHGCFWSPATGSPQESSAAVILQGLATSPGAPIQIRARNWNGDSQVAITTTVAQLSEYIPGYYAWQVAVTPAMLGDTYWRPAALGASSVAMGRLELSAFAGTLQLPTFTAAEQSCAQQKYYVEGLSASAAASACSTNNTLALFDNSAVGVAPDTTNWTVVASNPSVMAESEAGTTAVDVKIVRYSSPGAPTVYAMVCAPPGTTRRRAMVFNHGGASGLSVIEEKLCLDNARRGWVVAMSTYRGESMLVPNQSLVVPGYGRFFSWASWNLTTPAGAVLSPTPLISSGVVEISAGEVMDAHRLVYALRLQSNVEPNKIFLWGHSHGGSITLRALETAIPVQAAAAVAPATDWSQVVRDCQARRTALAPGDLPAGDACRLVLDGNTTVVPPIPSTPTIVGGLPPSPPVPGYQSVQRSYEWRSPRFFAKDLALRDDVTLLVQHGLSDNIVHPSQSCALMSASYEASRSRSWYVPSSAAPGVSIPTSALTECPGYAFDTPPPRPSSTGGWIPGARHFLVYRDLGHAGGAPVSTLWTDFYAYRDWLASIW